MNLNMSSSLSRRKSTRTHSAALKSPPVYSVCIYVWTEANKLYSEQERSTSLTHCSVCLIYHGEHESSGRGVHVHCCMLVCILVHDELYRLYWTTHVDTMMTSFRLWGGEQLMFNRISIHSLNYTFCLSGEKNICMCGKSGGKLKPYATMQ